MGIESLLILPVSDMNCREVPSRVYRQDVSKGIMFSCGPNVFVPVLWSQKFGPDLMVMTMKPTHLVKDELRRKLANMCQLKPNMNQFRSQNREIMISTSHRNIHKNCGKAPEAVCCEQI